ncbi:unnamed protein product [Jaminaea pallidilutea]
MAAVNSGSDGVNSGSNETDELYKALHHRLVTTGEWNRLSQRLEQLLLESNWTSDMTEYATERAKSMDKLSLDEMVRLVTDKGAKSVPKNVSDAILEKIVEFLDRNVEDV